MTKLTYQHYVNQVQDIYFGSELLVFRNLTGPDSSSLSRMSPQRVKLSQCELYSFTRHEPEILFNGKSYLKKKKDIKSAIDLYIIVWIDI